MSYPNTTQNTEITFYNAERLQIAEILIGKILRKYNPEFLCRIIKDLSYFNDFTIEGNVIIESIRMTLMNLLFSQKMGLQEFEALDRFEQELHPADMSKSIIEKIVATLNMLAQPWYADHYAGDDPVLDDIRRKFNSTW